MTALVLPSAMVAVTTMPVVSNVSPVKYAVLLGAVATEMPDSWRTVTAWVAVRVRPAL